MQFEHEFFVNLIDAKTENNFRCSIIHRIYAVSSSTNVNIEIDMDLVLSSKIRRIDRRTDLQKNHFRGVRTITGIVSRAIIGDAAVICGTSSFIPSFGIF